MNIIVTCTWYGKYNERILEMILIGRKWFPCFSLCLPLTARAISVNSSLTPPATMDNATEHDGHDLSPYELARLERIKRNEEYLQSLGLLKKKKQEIKPLSSKRSVHVVKKRKENSRKEVKAQPTRFSKRLKGIQVLKEQDFQDDPEQQITKEEPHETLDYNRMPTETEFLDDFEFQVFVSLRSWRLQKKRELDVEAYKICQNRTICELIRRRRNDSTFASQSAKEENDPIINDLLQVWGIGPSKAKPDGYGFEMLNVLDNEENKILLEKSRSIKVEKAAD